MAWAILILAGLLEVCWAIGLTYTAGFTRFWPSVVTLGFIAGQLVSAVVVRAPDSDWNGLRGLVRHRRGGNGHSGNIVLQGAGGRVPADLPDDDPRRNGGVEIFRDEINGVAMGVTGREGSTESAGLVLVGLAQSLG